MKKFTILLADTTHVFQHSIKNSSLIIEGPETMEASDGYHTFTELYDHRVTLFIALCKNRHYLNKLAPKVQYNDKEQGTVTILPCDVWRSKRHSDGELCFGTGTQFIMGIGKAKGQQITYHIPIERWEETNFAETLDQAPEWDGHTSNDVLDRLIKL